MTISSKNQPPVSIIMPVYNAQKFVASAIESVLAQTYQNWELVIVDDASIDSSWSIVCKYARTYPQKIRVFRLRKNINQGGDGAGNIAFQKTTHTTKFIARMDADDIALPQRLAKQVAFLLKHPDVSIVGSSVDIINDQNQIIGQKRVSTAHREIYRRFFELHPMIHPTVMIRRSDLFDWRNLYKLELSANNDYLTFAHLISAGKKFANLPEKLVLYRVHQHNDSIANLKRTLFNTIKVRWQMIRSYGYKPALRSWPIITAQVIVLSLVPEALLRLGYLMVRGMIQPKKIIPFLLSRPPLQLAVTK